MKRVVLALVIALAVPAISFADGQSAKDLFTQGDASAGATKATVCFACHGPNGNGAINPAWPKLAHQNSAYIYEQLQAFKSHQRSNPIMGAQAGTLSDEDMRNLAAYFAAQSFVPGVASKAAVAIAQPLFRGGDLKRHIPACAACHGPVGQGNPGVKYPRLGGQNATYVAAQLTAYKNGTRGAKGPGQIMQTVASQLTDKEIQALASYVSGLQ